MLSVLLWATLLVALVAWCAAATVGVVSVLIHPRRTPTTLGERVLWACRGVGYITAAVLAAVVGIYAAIGHTRPSLFAAVIIAFALVGLRMRHEHHGTRDGDANAP